MLKTQHAGKLWMVTQPDHGALAGFLAAHWGNEAFARPGHYAPVVDAERLRAQAVFAIAQHDNHWWEWEANPDLSADDGFPLGLGETSKNQQAGFDRWRLGLKRFAAEPMVNLLMSSHAYWFYAARVLAQSDPAFTHPLFWKGAPDKLYPGTIEAPLAFMEHLQALQSEWTAQLRADVATAAWVEPATLAPLQRLIQLCDGISLWLCGSLIPPVTGVARGIGEDTIELHDVPRRAWTDRVTITVTPLGGRRVKFDPYPFDIDPLPVMLPARIVELPAEKPANFQTWWHARVPQRVEFTIVSGK